MNVADFFIDVLEAVGPLAILLSIMVNVVISILGVVPSFFITAANIAVFGFWTGTAVSFLGESLGAIVSFYLYRKGIKAFAPNVLEKYEPLRKLQRTSGSEAFYLVVAFRLFPFMPSGLVTLAGATSGMGWLNFAVASTLGKVPALLIEAYSVYQVMQWTWVGQVILVGGAIVLVGMVFIKRRRN
ncbi:MULTISPECIES: TVP38/TMEM64 family protein [Bacillus]|uniref:TVP38/TMEM64 family protein n=1 Tax=Bacillus TaxID=1386 RepID=UPI000BB8B9EC|nr:MULTISPECIES: VTT domain-containing protein [Bacillus]